MGPQTLTVTLRRNAFDIFDLFLIFRAKVTIDSNLHILHRFFAKRNRSILTAKGPRYTSRFECVVIFVQGPCTHGSGSYILSCHGMDVRDFAHLLNGDAVVHHPFPK